MADDFSAGGYTFASDDVSSKQYPYVKLVYGADGTATLVSATNPVPVQSVGFATGSTSIGRLISGATTNATSLKASAGNVYAVIVTNTNAAVRYFKLYNKATSPTVGTDTPVITLAVPGATTGGGVVLSVPQGISFGTGIAYATTTGAADSDTAAVAANEIIATIIYV